MPFPHFHSLRINNPEKYTSFAMKELAPGISAVLGIKEGHSEIQALRFEKTKHTFNEAKKWATEHNYKPILEEEASGEAKKDSVDRIDGGGRLE